MKILILIASALFLFGCPDGTDNEDYDYTACSWDNGYDDALDGIPPQQHCRKSTDYLTGYKKGEK